MEHFYFSQKQKDLSLKLFEDRELSSYSEKFAIIDGKEVEYTEIVDVSVGSNWDDAVYLGEGEIYKFRNSLTQELPKLPPHLEALKMIKVCYRLMNKEYEDPEWPSVIEA